MLLVGLLALTSLLSAAVGAHPQAAEFDDIFVAATQAYDENRLPDAIQGWESLLHANQVLPEVLYNLGNARYRHGDLGQAIWAYRHAQRLAPRDPDIRANLNLAAQSAGITLPGSSRGASCCWNSAAGNGSYLASFVFGCCSEPPPHGLSGRAAASSPARRHGFCLV